MKKNIFVIALLFIGLSVYAQTIQVVNINNNVTPKKKSQFGVAIGGSASTNGFGGQVIIALNNAISVRAGYEQVNMTFPDALQYTISEIPLNISPTWKTGGMSAMVDLYLQRDFYITGGVVQTDLDLSAKLMSAESMAIGDITWEPADIGELNLTIRPLEKLAPYAGIGWGRNIARSGGLSMSLEIGAYYMKSYVVGLSGTGMFAGNDDNPSIAKLNETLLGFDWSGIFPVVKLGISFRVL